VENGYSFCREQEYMFIIGFSLGIIPGQAAQSTCIVE
jgi:hypothetical protein